MLLRSLIALSVGCASSANKAILMDRWGTIALLRLSITLRLLAISLRLGCSILLLLLIR
jgi:hypothetical protein